MDSDVKFEASIRAWRPDIVFPNPVSKTPSCKSWSLEAKKWEDPLQDPQYVDQLLKYVNSQGDRWGILTNGREWRLYNNRLDGIPVDRLVVSATLDEPYEMAMFVEAISKDSFCTGKVEARAKQLKVYQEIRQLLTDPQKSPLTKVLAKHYGMSDTDTADIIYRFAQNHFSPASTQASQAGASTNSAASPAQQSTPTITMPQNAPTTSVPPGPVPSQPQLPCPLQPTYRSWKDFYVAVVGWCYSQDPQETIRILQGMGHYYTTPQFTPETNFPATHSLPDNAGHFRTNLSSSHIQTCVKRFAQHFPQLKGCTVHITRQQEAGKPYEPWTIP